MKFGVILEPEEDGGYSVHVPALPGCHSQGDGREEAIDSIKEAIELYLDVLKEERQEIPRYTLGELWKPLEDFLYYYLQDREEHGLPLALELVEVEIGAGVAA